MSRFGGVVMEESCDFFDLRVNNPEVTCDGCVSRDHLQVRATLYYALN